MLLEEFEGQILLVKDVYEKNEIKNQGTHFLLRNYKDVLIKLEEERKIIAKPNAENRRKIKGKPTMNEKKVKITFPRKGK